MQTAPVTGRAQSTFIHQTLINGILLGFLIGLEQARYAVPPNFADTLPFVAVGENLVGIVVLGNRRRIVRQDERSIVAERFARQRVLVFPAKRKLEAFRLQVTGILGRYRGSVHAG